MHLTCAPVVQWMSVGLAIRRFGVRISGQTKILVFTYDSGQPYAGEWMKCALLGSAAIRLVLALLSNGWFTRLNTYIINLIFDA